MERRLDLTATLTTAGTVTPPIGPVPPTDTRAALDAAIDDAIDAALNAYHSAAIAKHEATERRLASGGLASVTDPEQRALGAARTALDRAIATDKARAVAAARPTPDEARRLLDEYDHATRHSYVTGGPEHLRTARTALLRALGVEA